MTTPPGLPPLHVHLRLWHLGAIHQLQGGLRQVGGDGQEDGECHHGRLDRFELSAGSYIIIPASFETGAASNFMIRVSQPSLQFGWQEQWAHSPNLTMICQEL